MIIDYYHYYDYGNYYYKIKKNINKKQTTKIT